MLRSIPLLLAEHRRRGTRADARQEAAQLSAFQREAGERLRPSQAPQRGGAQNCIAAVTCEEFVAAVPLQHDLD